MTAEYLKIHAKSPTAGKDDESIEELKLKLKDITQLLGYKKKSKFKNMCVECFGGELKYVHIIAVNVFASAFASLLILTKPEI